MASAPAQPFRVSSPAAPLRSSSPPAPFRVSAAVKPKITLASSLPVPVRPSAESVNPSTLTPRVKIDQRFNGIEAFARKLSHSIAYVIDTRRASSPRPPDIASAPAPPLWMSSPPAPISVSPAASARNQITKRIASPCEAGRRQASGSQHCLQG